MVASLSLLIAASMVDAWQPKHHGLMHVRSRTGAAGRSSGTVFQIFIPDDPNLAAPAKQMASASV